MNGWISALTAALLIAALWTDVTRMRIPNALTAGFAGAGTVFHAAAGGWQGLAAAVSGAVAGMLPLLLLYRLKGIGAGDVKWFGAFGVWSGPLPVLQLLVYSMLAAGGLSLLLLSLRLPGIRTWGRRVPWPWGVHPALAARGAAFPFMLAVAPGFGWMMGSGLITFG